VSAPCAPDTATVERIATPTAPPIWNEAFQARGQHGRVDLLLVHQQHVLRHHASEFVLFAAPYAALLTPMAQAATTARMLGAPSAFATETR
jgi:hypothetical protein